MTLIPTDQEQKIFDTLLRCNAELNLDLTFRVAGGWVRDKLLGKPSDDLDIALDKMTGRQFEAQLRIFAAKNPDAGIGKTYIVEETPGCKLETVAVKILDRKIDFNHLRSETYGEDSRVPEVKFGTPEIDAKRRDLTIGGLFFNVNTNQVEDFVGGLEDLKTMTLRTPLDPKETFAADPLRMLRLLRFFSRFEDASIVPEAIEAMEDPEVHAAYSRKVKAGRAGSELVKLAEGAKPARALRILFETGLDKVVFDVPETANLKLMNMHQQNKHHAFTLLDHTMAVIDNMSCICWNETPAMRVRLILAALFHDFGKRHPEIAKPKASDATQMTYIGHEDKSVEIGEAIMKSISVPDDDRKFVNKLVSMHMRPHAESWSNKTIGKFMRDAEIQGQDSKDVWLWIMRLGQADTLAKGIGEEDFADFNLKAKHVEQMREFLNRPGPSCMMPILDGFELMNLFPNTDPSHSINKVNFIKEINARLLDEQANGTIQDRDQAKALVETMRADIESKYRHALQKPLPKKTKQKLLF